MVPLDANNVRSRPLIRIKNALTTISSEVGTTSQMSAMMTLLLDLLVCGFFEQQMVEPMLRVTQAVDSQFWKLLISAVPRCI